MSMFSRFSTMFNNVRNPGGGGGRRGGGGDRGHGGGHPGQGRPSPSSNSPSSSKKSRSGDGGSGGGATDTQAVQFDNSEAVIAKIARLYAERLMSDITLVIRINGMEVEYPSHRLILCASSDVFQVMLMNTNWNESKESRIVLQESVECAEIFEDFLKYLYTGILKLELPNVLHVLVLADKYNVKDLITLCLSYMKMHIPAAANQSQLILWFQYTSNFGQDHAKIAECCRNYLKWNLETVFKTAEDFPHLELDLFTSILAEDDVVVSDEYQLYQIAEYWLQCRTERRCESDFEIDFENEFSRMVNLTMQHIRFPMMSPRQIADLIQSSLVRTCKTVMEMMALAMQFHNGCMENDVDMEQSYSAVLSSSRYKNRLSSSSNPNYKLFTPRLYCTDQWSVCIVAPFEKMQHYQAQTLFCTTPSSFSDVMSKSDKQVEWCLDFFPKAVQFQKFCVIGWHETTEVPEHILKTVRLSILCRAEEDVRVHIGVLIAGSQDGVEHVRSVVQKNYIFSDGDRVLNIDNLLPYGDLNPCAECVARCKLQDQNPTTTSSSPSRGARMSMSQDFPTSPQTSRSRCQNNLGSGSPNPTSQQQNLSNDNHSGPCSSCRGAGSKSCFFVGSNLDSVKIRIVITPLP